MRCSAGSHVSSCAPKPFQRTRYSTCRRRPCRLASTLSTSYSTAGPSSCRAMGAGTRGCPCTAFSWLLWKTGCTRQWDGSSKRHASALTSAAILKGPAHLAASFRLSCFKGRFCVDSHTESPTRKEDARRRPSA